jgi:hypothetical protein
VDKYMRFARLYPALLATFPVLTLALVAVVTVPSWWARVSGLGVAAGVPVLAASVAGHLGKVSGKRLYEEWGGAPTTLMLRWNAEVPPATQTARHEEISRVSGLVLPDAATEATDQVAADGIYEAAVERLRALTRDHELVQAENRSFGFWRNLYGCRLVAEYSAYLTLTLAFGTVLVSAVTGVAVNAGAALLAGVLALAWWPMMRVLLTPDRVRMAGDAYALALLTSTPTLPTRT